MRLVHVEALPDLRLHLRFSDGVEGTLDLRRFAGRGVFRLWDEPGGFDRVHIGPAGEAQWSDAVALCPDALYLEVTGKSPEDLFPNLREAPLRA